MKKMFVLAAFATLSVAGFAQGKMESSKMEKSTMMMKEHVCNKDCKADKCSFKHGEKGHTCTAECKKMMDKK